MARDAITAGPLHERIVSVDFWRGISLMMIFVDHIPGNPVSVLTLRSWAFADAAEVFVFLAGISAILAFDRYFRYGGFVCGCLRVAKRTWQLFRAHVLLVFALSIVIAAAGLFTDSKPIMEQMNFSPFFVETEVAILRIVKLQYMPNLTDVLPIYVVFIGMLPLLWLLMEFSPYAALAASGALWAAANITGQSLPNYPEGVTWFFNPLAWQFMFVSGAVLARMRGSAVALLRSRLLLGAAAAFVIVSIIAVAPWINIHALSEYRIVPARFLPANDKTNLSFIRIVNFFALVLLSARLLGRDSTFWKRRLSRMIETVGRHALPVYCAGVVMALVAQIFFGIRNSGVLEVVSVTFAGLAILVALAFALEAASAKLASVDKTRRAVSLPAG